MDVSPWKFAAARLIGFLEQGKPRYKKAP